MSEINDQSSDASLELNWSIDHLIEGRQHDRVVFKAVPDQYVKGEDVTAFFTILQEVKINADEDQIGLLRVGSTNLKECLAYANVQFSPSTSELVRHGTAKFPSSLLPETDDEFYQFCYIYNKTKNLGSSLPFQLNCPSDDIALREIKPGEFIGFEDPDNGLVVIQTKHVVTEEKLRQEYRQLSRIIRRLELKKEECQVKLEALEAARKEQINKLKNDMQNDLERENRELTERLAASAEEYKVLFLKYTALEHRLNLTQQQESVEPINNASFDDKDVNVVLVNTCEIPEIPQNPPISLPRNSMPDIDAEVLKCPMCFWEFPANLNMEGKREHIEQHFD